MNFDQIKPWERQPGESGKAFTCFRHYLEQGPRRTVEATGKWYRQQQGSSRAASAQQRGNANYIGGWSKRYSWRDRAEAFDREEARRIDAERLKVRQQAIIDAGERHGQQSRAFAQFAVALLSRAAALLSSPDPNAILDPRLQALLDRVQGMMGHLPKLHADERAALAGSPENYATVISPPTVDPTEDDDDLMDLSTVPWLVKRALQVAPGSRPRPAARRQGKPDPAI